MEDDFSDFAFFSPKPQFIDNRLFYKNNKIKAQYR